MGMNFLFLVNSMLLGVGLAMDAFSVSLANGLSEPSMRKRRMCAISSVYAVFQGVMPMIGWVCVKKVVQYFQSFQKFIPWIALLLLLYIGGSMLWEGVRGDEEKESKGKLTVGVLLLQGIATSIDALSVGFTIEKYDLPMALVSVTLIALVTFVICLIGLYLGKKIGTKFAGRANVLGGVILIVIGIEIFVTGVFF
ncbi:MAG: manganese efflux pump [Eubacterium sp.]|nr:manganese efflux pump [Eubacterium sp.]